MAESKIQGKQMLTRTITYDSELTIAQEAFQRITIDASYSGYKPIAIVSIYTNGTSAFAAGDVAINNDDSIQVMVWNLFSNGSRTGIPTFTILYQKI